MEEVKGAIMNEAGEKKQEVGDKLQESVLRRQEGEGNLQEVSVAGE